MSVKGESFMFRIIIADDNALSIKGLECNLDFASLDAELVGAFCSGKDVLEYVRAHEDVDLIVSDIRMPHMTGLELAREVLKVKPCIKIVFISAYTDFEWAQEALRIGAADYVQKPIIYPELQEAMRNALTTLQAEREIQARLEQAMPEMRSRFFQDLLHAHPDIADRLLESQADYLGIPVSGGAFLCLAVAWEQMDSTLDTESRLLDMLALQEQLAAWFQPHLTYHHVWQRDTLIAVLHGPGISPENMPAHVEKLCASFIDAHQDLAANLVFGVGKASSSLWYLPLSLDSAERALISRFIHEDSSVFVDPLDASDDLTFFTGLSASQRQLSECVLNNDTVTQRLLTTQISERLARRCTQSTVVYSYLMMLCTGILDHLRLGGVNFDDVTRMLNNLDSQNRHLLEQKVVDELLNAFLGQTVKALNDSQQTQHQLMVRRVQQYVNENIDNPDLGLEDIAAQMHMSKSHLSRVLKKGIGTNFSDWITRQRITRAQQLLRQTDASVSVISAQVGYASPYYFSACFKKITGKTPSEYRTLSLH